MSIQCLIAAAKAEYERTDISHFQIGIALGLRDTEPFGAKNGDIDNIPIRLKRCAVFHDRLAAANRSRAAGEYLPSSGH
jgi:hypothetical protein